MHKTPGSDGMVWIALPDNAPMDMTVTANGFHHYNAGATPQKYTPVVTANSVPLDPDIVVDGATNFWVGQNMAFSVSGLPDYVDSVQHWTLPGNYVNESYAYSSVCTSYRKNTDLLTNLSTSCWYVDKVDAGTASIGMNLHFSNGQDVSIAALGKFDMIKPKVSWVGTQPGTIAVDINFERSTSGEPWLHFGFWLPDNPPESQDPGTKCTLDAGGLNGTLFSDLQLITSFSSEFCKANGQTTHLSGSGRDDSGLLAAYTNFYFDDPGAPLPAGYVHVTDTGSFQTFLMFKPADSSSGASIAVPLKFIAWDWSGVADDLSSGWSLTSSSKHVTISDQDTTTFPVWSNIVTQTSGYTTTTDTNCN
ncbi:MAG TPA: hypothetical protein VHY30_02140 [Verrucomicrobiae bacterium]|nr:hypothetical protein [Verrucomicrobiae bacterium]